MDVGILLKIAGIGVLVTIIHQILSKSGREEQATFVTIGGIVVVLSMLITEFGTLIQSVRTIFGL